MCLGGDCVGLEDPKHAQSALNNTRYLLGECSPGGWDGVYNIGDLVGDGGTHHIKAVI